MKDIDHVLFIYEALFQLYQNAEFMRNMEDVLAENNVTIDDIIKLEPLVSYEYLKEALRRTGLIEE